MNGVSINCQLGADEGPKRDVCVARQAIATISQSWLHELELENTGRPDFRNDLKPGTQGNPPLRAMCLGGLVHV